ncbi:MAG: L-threonylcarbamoyladenylate synthase [Paludibacter sp.]|nr:L-threonylcarbamoyladenylate synthase [Paludibacter sp.]
MVIGKDVDKAAGFIRNGGLVAFPTETVYGLGADALNPLAVAAIFKTKKRPTFDPLIVHISDIAQIEDLFEKPIAPVVYKLAAHFWPGPLTIVHRKSTLVPDIVTSGMDTVAVRMPAHPLAQELIRKAGVPVAAPSANRFGQLSPTRHEHVVKQTMEIDYLLVGDYDIIGIESTVLYVDNETVSILRPGYITAKDILELDRSITIINKGENLKVSSPGLLKSHYSPLKPLYYFTNDMQELPEKSGLILHQIRKTEPIAEKIIYTSRTGNLFETAANLFTALHAMEDNPAIDTIFIEPVPETGLGIAIMDRLRKATYRYSKTK